MNDNKKRTEMKTSILGFLLGYLFTNVLFSIFKPRK